MGKKIKENILQTPPNKNMTIKKDKNSSEKYENSNLAT